MGCGTQLPRRKSGVIRAIATHAGISNQSDLSASDMPRSTTAARPRRPVLDVMPSSLIGPTVTITQTTKNGHPFSSMRRGFTTQLSRFHGSTGATSSESAAASVPAATVPGSGVSGSRLRQKRTSRGRSERITSGAAITCGAICANSSDAFARTIGLCGRSTFGRPAKPESRDRTSRPRRIGRCRRWHVHVPARQRQPRRGECRQLPGPLDRCTGRVEVAPCSPEPPRRPPGRLGRHRGWRSLPVVRSSRDGRRP